MKEKNLLNALLTVFSRNDAVLLTKLLQDNLDKEIIHHEEIDIVENQKTDLILLAFEERILIPVKSRSGPAWEDKLLDFEKGGYYFIPPVVKAILGIMCDAGEVACHEAVRKVLSTVIEKNIIDIIKLLQTVMKHANNYIFETGLLDIFFKKTAIEGDLHDVVDILVICGIMSPCPQKSLLTGLSWYEINPSLYWDKAFLSGLA
jgi:hypothetical protein